MRGERRTRLGWREGREGCGGGFGRRRLTWVVSYSTTDDGSCDGCTTDAQRKTTRVCADMTQVQSYEGWKRWRTAPRKKVQLNIRIQSYARSCWVRNASSIAVVFVGSASPEMPSAHRLYADAHMAPPPSPSRASSSTSVSTLRTHRVEGSGVVSCGGKRCGVGMQTERATRARGGLACGAGLRGLRCHGAPSCPRSRLCLSRVAGGGAPKLRVNVDESDGEDGQREPHVHEDLQTPPRRLVGARKRQNARAHDHDEQEACRPLVVAHEVQTRVVAATERAVGGCRAGTGGSGA